MRCKVKITTLNLDQMRDEVINQHEILFNFFEAKSLTSFNTQNTDLQYSN